MDYYELLGIRKSATAAELRRAFRKLARQLHPALNPGDPQAGERYRAVQAAFEVLSDPQRRADYDRGEPTAPVVAPAVPHVGFEGFDFSVTGAAAGFREIFDTVLRPGAEPPARGEDLEQTARIRFEEALGGTGRRVHVVRQDLCSACGGAGELSHQPVTWPRCSGTGQLRARRGHMVFSRRCPDCGARGVLGTRACARCAGEGRVMQSEWLEVQIPAGAGAGCKLRIPGAGNAGLRGGPPGDLVLAVEVEPHGVFRREGEDLHCVVPVTMMEAAAGAHVAAPTPDGEVTIEIPAGTQAGQRFRLRKRGMPRLGGKGRGDLWVEVRVWVPTLTDERSRELVQELMRLHPQDPRRPGAGEGA